MRSPASTILVALLCATTFAAGAAGLNGRAVVLCVDGDGHWAVEGRHAAHRGCHGDDDGGGGDSEHDHHHDAHAAGGDDHADPPEGGGAPASCEDLSVGVQFLERGGASPDDLARVYWSGRLAPDLAAAPLPRDLPSPAQWLGPPHPSGARPRAELGTLRTFILLT